MVDTAGDVRVRPITGAGLASVPRPVRTSKQTDGGTDGENLLACFVSSGLRPPVGSPAADAWQEARSPHTYEPGVKGRFVSKSVEDSLDPLVAAVPDGPVMDGVGRLHQA